MVKLYDYHCLKCKGNFTDVFAEPEDRDLPCECGGVMNRVYLKWGGMMGKTKGLFPYFDTQLGRKIESPRHREEVAKSLGWAPVSNEEYKRQRNNEHLADEAPVVSDDAFYEMAQEAWERGHSGEIIPQDTEPEPVTEAAHIVAAE